MKSVRVCYLTIIFAIFDPKCRSNSVCTFFIAWNTYYKKVKHLNIYIYVFRTTSMHQNLKFYVNIYWKATLFQCRLIQMAKQPVVTNSGLVANPNISIATNHCDKTFAKSKKNFQKSILKNLMPIIFSSIESQEMFLVHQMATQPYRMMLRYCVMRQ